MITTAWKRLDHLLQLFFPHNCEGCGTDVLNNMHLLCARCLHSLPATGFFDNAHNPIEKLFYGRIPVSQAGAAYYFTKQSLLQHLLIQLKYKHNKEAGYFLGRMMGNFLLQSGRFNDVNAIVPLPLHEKKEFQRGYNQAAILCRGIQETWHKPVLWNAVSRNRFTETQTHKTRSGRWQNMQGVFEVANTETLTAKHILLVDDVITTGATLEACGGAILQIKDTRLSIAAAAFTL